MEKIMQITNWVFRGSGSESDPHKVSVRVVAVAASKSIINACGFNECLFWAIEGPRP